MEERHIKVSNVKGHFKYKAGSDPSVPKDLLHLRKSHSNFWSIRLTGSTLFGRTIIKKLVLNRSKPDLTWTVKEKNSEVPFPNKSISFVVFPSSSHVNVSGIPNFELCQSVKVAFERLFGADTSGSLFHIDNSTASCVVAQERLNLLKLSRLAYQSHYSDNNTNIFPFYPCTVSVRQHYFPSALIRPGNKEAKKKVCTIILFSNAKAILIGAKSKSQLVSSFDNLKPVLSSIAQ